MQHVSDVDALKILRECHARNLAIDNRTLIYLEGLEARGILDGVDKLVKDLIGVGVDANAAASIASTRASTERLVQEVTGITCADTLHLAAECVKRAN